MTRPSERSLIWASLLSRQSFGLMIQYHRLLVASSLKNRAMTMELHVKMNHFQHILFPQSTLRISWNYMQASDITPAPSFKSNRKTGPLLFALFDSIVIKVLSLTHPSFSFSVLLTFVSPKMIPFLLTVEKRKSSLSWRTEGNNLLLLRIFYFLESFLRLFKFFS